MSQERELFEWVKASEEKSLHYEDVFIRWNVSKIVAYYDNSTKEYRAGTRAYSVSEVEWLKLIKPESITNSSIEQMAEEKDLIIAGIAEGAEQWKAEYDNCRAILKELVYLKRLKESSFKEDIDTYEKRKPLAWDAARKFLEKYQHQ